MRVIVIDIDFDEEHLKSDCKNWTKPWGCLQSYPKKSCRVSCRDTLFVCVGSTGLFNIWGHITTVPACSSGTLPHRNVMPQTQDMTSQPIRVYRHGADLSLCYPLIWNVTLEYTTTHFNFLGETRPGNPSPTFHINTPATAQFYDAVMVVVSQKLGRKFIVPTGSWTRDLWCANPLRYPLAHCRDTVCISIRTPERRHTRPTGAGYRDYTRAILTQ